MKVLFDPDKNQVGGTLTKDRRNHYFRLCNMLVSRNPDFDYPRITNEIIDIIYMEVQSKILEFPDVPSDQDKKSRMITSIHEIFKSAKVEDTNYIGKVNIISLQCIILFTENCIKPDQEIVAGGIYENYLNLRRGNWKNYTVMQGLLSLDTAKDYYIGGYSHLYNNEHLGPYTTSLDPNFNIFLITIIDYLTLDEINNSFLDNVIYCGMTSEFTYADGSFYSPFEFLHHDIVHGKNYHFACYNRNGLIRTDLKTFYEYSKTVEESPESPFSQIYAMKLMMFLLIHESLCDFFTSSTTKDTILHSILKAPQMYMARFLNDNDLGLSLPKKVRGNPELITEYLGWAADVYLSRLRSWREATAKAKANEKPVVKPEGVEGGNRRRTPSRRRRTLKSRRKSKVRTK